MLVAEAVSEALTGSFGARRLARLGTFGWAVCLTNVFSRVRVTEIELWLGNEPRQILRTSCESVGTLD
jgi:hypothetical protein